jgi:iodotyrosine deiodinase
MTAPTFVPLTTYKELAPEQMRERAASFYEAMNCRRTVREFSPRDVPRDVIENCIRTAGTAPSGAHQQPWKFVVVSNLAIRHEIRLAAEKEEREFYSHRAPPDWLAALAPLGTNDDKRFLDIAPYLIIVFVESHGVAADGARIKHYYATESVGIATGMLIAALHTAGLATLTHTPSPMGFLNQILGRPANERPFLNLVVGYPADGVTVPSLSRKSLDAISTFL